jgi:hypothetical protein
MTNPSNQVLFPPSPPCEARVLQHGDSRKVQPLGYTGQCVRPWIQLVSEAELHRCFRLFAVLHKKRSSSFTKIKLSVINFDYYLVAEYMLKDVRFMFSERCGLPLAIYMDQLIDNEMSPFCFLMGDNKSTDRSSLVHFRSLCFFLVCFFPRLLIFPSIALVLFQSLLLFFVFRYLTASVV